MRFTHTHISCFPLVAPAAKPPAREDTVQTSFLPHKSFPEKSPVNGTSEQPPKTVGGTAAPSYNRYVPKPYTTSARPFERKFDSPKFNHNLLPNDKPDSTPKVSILNFNTTLTQLGVTAPNYHKFRTI